MSLGQKETYYEILKVAKNASDAEITAAYNKAKAAFSQDSMAAYSILDPRESEAILKQLDEAYNVLSNLDRRRKYDHLLANGIGHAETHEMRSAVGSEVSSGLSPRVDPSLSLADTSELPRPSTTPSGDVLDPVNGEGLEGVRNRCHLSIEDVARITKIPKRYLHALEKDDFKTLPARVYVQGFVKSLCTLYRLPQAETIKNYLAFFDASHPDTES